jgi:hypothetical protein
MSFKTWVFIILDAGIIAVVIKVVFKEYGLFFRALWNWTRPLWYLRKSPDDDLYTSYKLVFIVIVLGFLAWAESALFS